MKDSKEMTGDRRNGGESADAPWSINAGTDYCGTRIDGANGRAVGHAIQRDPHPTLGQGITTEQALANARLMAAAPDLLAALEGAYALAIGHAASYQFNHQLDALHETHQKILDAARAAIAKATGEQP